jgi:hypothetical protein
MIYDYSSSIKLDTPSDQHVSISWAKCLLLVKRQERSMCYVLWTTILSNQSNSSNKINSTPKDDERVKWLPYSGNYISVHTNNSISVFPYLIKAGRS